MIDMVREFRAKNKPAVGAKMPRDFVDLWCQYWNNQLRIASRKAMSLPQKAGLA